MEKSLEELKQEAEVLGIKYMPKISAGKLAQKIEAHYTSLSAGDSVVAKKDSDDAEPVKNAGTVKPLGKSKDQIIREMAAEAKRNAMATKIVTISSNDKRDSEWTTTAYLSMENQYFGVSRLVPLDIPIELENCLIDVAKTTMITLHKDEIVDGRRTGNKVPVSTRKYNVSYEDIKK